MAHTLAWVCFILSGCCMAVSATMFVRIVRDQRKPKGKHYKRLGRKRVTLTKPKQ